jgi:hypothetical protein
MNITNRSFQPCAAPLSGDDRHLHYSWTPSSSPLAEHRLDAA